MFSLPLLVVTKGKNQTAILTDPYFSSLFDKGSIRWIYPKEVGFEDLVEKPSADDAPSNLAIIGRYILTPLIFPALQTTERGRGGEIQLTDGLKGLLSAERVLAYRFHGKRYDAGEKLGFLKATVEFALKNGELGPEFRKYLKSLNLD